MLGEFGYYVIPCTSADEALAIIARDDTIDMVLTDVVMPGEIDGWHLAERIRNLRPRIKVAFTSGYVMPSTRSILTARHELFLPKPWRPDALADLIRRAFAT